MRSCRKFLGNSAPAVCDPLELGEHFGCEDAAVFFQNLDGSGIVRLAGMIIKEPSFVEKFTYGDHFSSSGCAIGYEYIPLACASCHYSRVGGGIYVPTFAMYMPEKVQIFEVCSNSKWKREGFPFLLPVR